MKNLTKKNITDEGKETKKEPLKEFSNTVEGLPSHLKVPMQTILYRIKGTQINAKGEQEIGTVDVFANHTNIGRGMLLIINNFINRNPNINILGCEVVNAIATDNILTEQE